MKNIILFVCLAGFSFSLFAQQPELSGKEKRKGWILLFDGKSFAGWKTAKGMPVPAERWTIDNGILSTMPLTEGITDIITEESFAGFELVMEFRVTEGANSGVKYYILSGTTLGCEYQIVDNNIYISDVQKHQKQLQGSLYDLIPPSKDAGKSVGQWNTLRIVSDGKNIEHWLNGKKIVEFNRSSELFREIVSKSKFVKVPEFATPAQSPVLLQDHGGVVSFRNIKIRKLSK